MTKLNEVKILKKIILKDLQGMALPSKSLHPSHRKWRYVESARLYTSNANTLKTCHWHTQVILKLFNGFIFTTFGMKEFCDDRSCTRKNWNRAKDSLVSLRVMIFGHSGSKRLLVQTWSFDPRCQNNSEW